MESADALGLGVRTWVDGDDPYRLVSAALGGGPVATGVSDSMPALHLLPLAAALDVLPVLATDVLRELRMIKEEAEIDALRRAGSAIDRVHARVPELLVPGRTEADVAADIAEAIVAEGHSEVAFVIVGSGPHGADPHHRFSDRTLQAGDIVVVDIGGPSSPDTTPTVLGPTASANPNQLWRSTIRFCSGRSAPRLTPCDPVYPPPRSTRRRVVCWPRLVWPTISCTAPGTASGCACTKSPTSWPAMTWRWLRA
ncbi:hypothetical protein NIIDMKKI_30050 [Mycobacterium kansasii]|nr:hypothetical protein NIIDMKKI_30050 [Mycobacterium kansasii]